jgi:hypothetical protein
MDEFLEIVVAVIVILIVGYMVYQYFISHPSDKYHNESWKEKRRKNKY